MPPIPPDDEAAASERDTALAESRRWLEHALAAGEPGGSLVAGLSDAVSRWIVEHAAPLVQAGSEAFGPMALASVGALSRRELGPRSDVDLVLLASEAGPGSEALSELVGSVVQPMYDAQLRPNLVVHEPTAWLDQADAELPLATALLDVRYLCGQRSLVDDLAARGRERYADEGRIALLDRLDADVEERHGRFGDTVYLVEPDLKYGPGGLRDLAIVAWSLQATFGTRDLDELAARGVLPRPVARIVDAARDTLLRLRVALQLAANRPQDRLVFQYQELVPPLLGLVDPNERVPDDVLVEAIERAMQEYFRSARDLVRYGERIRARCRPESNTPPSRRRRLDERFAVAHGQLVGGDAGAFRSAPVLALEALALTSQHQVSLSGETFDAIAEAAVAPASYALADEPEAADRLLDLLCDPDDVAVPSALELCNELGLLERVIPEFGPIRGRMQHDSYHVYTVDQHTLQAVAMLKRIARGEHNKDYPLATALHLEIDDPRVLYLAALVHDTGKALAGDQCITGAAVAQRVARRLRLADEDAARCGNLVREHITMPLLGLKRDLTDPGLIGDFAGRVDRHSLKELYLLSLVDTAQVRPGNLTGWKLALLDEVYLRTAAHLARGRPRPRRAARPAEPAQMPERYYSLFHQELRESHQRLIERLHAEKRRALLDLEVGSGALRLTMVALDRPGLLAHATEVLSDHGIDVMAADVFTSPGPPPVAVDVFRVETRGAPEQGVAVETLTEMERALDQESPDLAKVPPPLFRGLQTGQEVPTRVSFESDPWGDRTIVDVEAQAGPGTLQRLTQAFAAEGHEILVARCGTEAGRANDVFYVRPLQDAERDALRERIELYLRHS